MFQKEFEIVENARDFMARTRPIFIEKHDISAKLFRDKEASEPSFSFSAKGENRFDIFRILTWVVLLFAGLCSMRVYFGLRKLKRRRKKEMKRREKEKRRKSK